MASLRDLYKGLTDKLSYGSGNWLGLPEFGLTEDRLGGKTQSVKDATYRNSTVGADPSSKNVLGSNTINKFPSNDRADVYNDYQNNLPTYSSKIEELTRQTNESKSSNDDSKDGSSKYNDPNYYDTGAILDALGINRSEKDKYFERFGVDNTPDLYEAMKKSNEAELKQAGAQYDRTKENLLSQQGNLDKQYGTQKQTLENLFGSYKKQIGELRTNAQNMYDREVEQGLRTAKDTQKASRNTLRALGILGSSAAGEMLQRPMNEFGRQRADMSMGLQERFSQLDNALEQRTAEHATAVQSLINNYNQLSEQIRQDLSFNERDRVNALNSARAALEERIAQIKYQQQMMEQEVAQQKDLMAYQMELQNQYTPAGVNTGSIDATVADLIGSGGETPQQVSTYFGPGGELRRDEETISPITASMTPEDQRRYEEMLLSNPNLLG